MNKIMRLRIMVSTVMVCVLSMIMIVFTNTHQQAKVHEMTTIQLTTEKQQETIAVRKVRKKVKKKKKKISLFSEKYKNLTVIKVGDETETQNSDNNVSDEIAEIYKQKSLSSEEAGVALDGCVVKVLSKDKNWTKIKSGKVEGYVESKYVVKGVKAKKVLLDTEHILAKMNKNNTMIKGDKSQESSNIGIAYARTTYPIVEISKDEKWIKIKRTETLSGWIPVSSMILKIEKEYAYTSEEYDEMVESEWKAEAGTYKLEKSKLPKSGEARELIEYASKFLGNRYVWGGISLTKGADCSGFVQSVFRHFGYCLNRTAAEQSRNGKSVSNNQLKPGDLLFYHTDRRQKNRISHVAIYIGYGKIIHAANRRAGIIISSMGNPCMARRILTGKSKQDKKEKTKIDKGSRKSKKHKNKENYKKQNEEETTKIIETTQSAETEKQQETTSIQSETTECKSIDDEN
ncbi:MAG: C40 family peptidase [Eubacterium sp.]|nr:C40 family peptidase [Eubacterium sp.]